LRRQQSHGVRQQATGKQLEYGGRRPLVLRPPQLNRRTLTRS